MSTGVMDLALIDPAPRNANVMDARTLALLTEALADARKRGEDMRQPLLVRPKADGEEQLTFNFGQFSVNLPVKVAGAEVARPSSFVQDVQPAFSKMGCNAGTCHGSKEGKKGFKLSLRGYDPLYDHRAFTDDHGAGSPAPAAATAARRGRLQRRQLRLSVAAGDAGVGRRLVPHRPR